LINWILQELEKQPNRLFYEKELTERDASEFARLKELKFLTYVQPDERSETYSFGQSKPLAVVKIGGQLYGIDEDDPEEDPVPLQRSDLARYRFCLDQFANQLRVANSLTDASFSLDRRLLLLGKRTTGRVTTAFVFALFDSDKRAQSLLLSLPVQLGRRIDGIVVITPSYEVNSAPLTSQLEPMQIHVIPRRATENWMVNISALFKEMPVPAPLPKFTVGQERDYELYGYKCKLPIHVTGEIAKSGNNVVLVGDTSVELGDVPFLLFLRLVVELHRDRQGTVSKIDLKSDGYLSEDAEFQSIKRLRQCFVRALSKLDPKDFIEVYRPKTLRVSVHPELVTWDAEKLSTHDDSRVKWLMAQLTETV